MPQSKERGGNNSESLNMLKVLDQGVKNNPRIFYAGCAGPISKYGEAAKPNNPYLQTYAIVVSPPEPTSDLKKLKLFMKKITKEKPEEKVEFHEDDEGNLHLGILRFKQEKDSVEKVIEIRVYPSPGFANFVLENEIKRKRYAKIYPEEALVDKRESVSVDIYSLREKIDKDLLNLLKKQENAFTEEQRFKS